MERQPSASYLQYKDWRERGKQVLYCSLALSKSNKISLQAHSVTRYMLFGSSAQKLKTYKQKAYYYIIYIMCAVTLHTSRKSLHLAKKQSCTKGPVKKKTQLNMTCKLVTAFRFMPRFLLFHMQRNKNVKERYLNVSKQCQQELLCSVNYEDSPCKDRLI